MSADDRAGRLARTGLETFAAVWDALRELDVRRAALLAEIAAEERRLEAEVRYLVGAVQKAQGLAPPAVDAEALTRPAGLQALAAEAEARLLAARAALQERRARELGALDEEQTALRAHAEALIARAGEVRPSLEVEVARLGPSHVIVQLRSPTDDEALLLLDRLAGRLPTRWGYLRDDTVHELGHAAPLFYPDEGLSPEEASTEEDAAQASLDERTGRFLPVRGHLPIALDGAPGLQARFVHRGPVLELQCRRAPGAFQTHVPREDAEHVTARLLLLKLSRRLELELRFV